ncbi:DNA adenine methylase [Agrobacterium pusense]|uniref:DNA adenine methylase n=1 Tax=Agrobacterium pusense TaxID=648995 RepID=UPI000D1B77C1|nr:DNA adenine methylase [Agrobacterium pusense]WFN87050.1 DNA adenine methylase [Agrobacterium pusense]
MTNYSPLRYPGGKGKLAGYVASVLSLNDLEGGHYAEPFAGGAAVALELLMTERVKHIHINDIDWCVYSFWKSAVHHTDDLIALIESTPVTMESWMMAREVKRRGATDNIVASGFSTFFLNRTNRSGILNGGVIGGLEQAGEWKIGCRYNKDDLINKIRRIGMYRSRISVTQLDASHFLGKHMEDVDAKCLIYIDPPYYVKGASLYQNHFVHKDHVALAEIVGRIKKHSWFVSYDNVAQIRLIYSAFDQEQFSIGYSARNHGHGSEVMIFGPGVDRPERIYSSKTQLKSFKRLNVSAA